MKKSDALNYINKFLVENENYTFERPQKITDILEIEEKEIWKNDVLTVKTLFLKGRSNNYQYVITLNDREIYVSEVNNKKSKIYFCEQVLFFVDDKITTIPLNFLLISYIKENPYNVIKNAIYNVEKEEDIKFLVMNKDENERIALSLLKYQNKLNNHLYQDKLYTIASNMIVLSTLISAINDFKGIITIGAISLTTLLFQLYNNHCINKCVKMNQNDLTTLTEYALILENVVALMKTKQFNIPNEFSLIKEKTNNTLLQNEHLHLYESNTKGYINDKLLNQTSLFINDIEFWHGDYEQEKVPIVVFDNCVYVLKGEGIAIPFPYILESVYEDNPVDSINDLLEKDKIKQLKR